MTLPTARTFSKNSPGWAGLSQASLPFASTQSRLVVPHPPVKRASGWQGAAGPVLRGGGYTKARTWGEGGSQGHLRFCLPQPPKKVLHEPHGVVGRSHSPDPGQHFPGGPTELPPTPPASLPQGSEGARLTLPPHHPTPAAGEEAEALQTGNQGPGVGLGSPSELWGGQGRGPSLPSSGASPATSGARLLPPRPPLPRALGAVPSVLVPPFWREPEAAGLGGPLGCAQQAGRWDVRTD